MHLHHLSLCENWWKMSKNKMFRILYLLFLQLGIAFNLPNCELGYEVD